MATHTATLNDGSIKRFSYDIFQWKGTGTSDVIDDIAKAYLELLTFPEGGLLLSIVLLDAGGSLPVPPSLDPKQGFTYIAAGPEDLPDDIGGEITIPAGASIQFTTDEIEFSGKWITFAGKSAIVGSSSETTMIKSTGLVGAFIRSNFTLRIRDIAFHDMEGAASAVALDGLGAVDAALDWNAVNFVDCIVGTIEDYSNFIYTAGAWLDSSGLILDGGFGTVEVSTSLVNPGAGTTAITIAATCIISRRFRVRFSAFIVLAGETGIKIIDRATSFPTAESFFLLNVSFSGGGTYLDGISAQDNEALIEKCNGVSNSADVAHYFAIGNAAATDTSTAGAGVFVKGAGVTTDGPNVAKFTQTNNRATYIGSLTGFFFVDARFTATSNNNNQLAFKLFKNGLAISDSLEEITANAGGRVESGGTFTIVELTENDYIELWCANNTGANDIVLENFRLAIRV